MTQLLGAPNINQQEVLKQCFSKAGHVSRWAWAGAISDERAFLAPG